MSEYVSPVKGILLGFEIETGKPVYLSVHHLAIFGMTQKSGKTTTLEALITRSKLRAIAFKTKRGETGFHKVNPITPYYKPRADWQFIEGLVNVALGEKVKYEPAMRWAIMKVSEGTHDLTEVMEKAIELREESRKSFIKQTFEKLVNYLKIVVPELKKWVFSDTLDLEDGVNVMDLSKMRLETQQIVIASTIEYVFDNLRDTVVVIPEAWETLPQSKMTPVKWVAERFIRKGASIGNYLWIDSQDIGGISKVPLRQCDNWIMGRMKEAHEVSRILKQLLGLKIPLREIQTLPLGHFYAVIGDQVKKVYVLPVGVPENIGVKVARGELTPEYVRDIFLKPKLKPDLNEGGLKILETIDILTKKNKVLSDQKKLLEAKVESLGEALDIAEKDLKLYDELRIILAKILPKATQISAVIPQSNVEKLNLQHKELIVSIKHSEKALDFSTETQQGQIIFVAINDLPKEGFTEKMLSEALKERGWNISHTSLAPHLGSNLPKSGVIIKIPNTRPMRYRLPQKLKINVEKGSKK